MENSAFVNLINYSVLGVATTFLEYFYCANEREPCHLIIVNVCAICPTHLIILDLIALIMFCEAYKL